MTEIDEFKAKLRGEVESAMERIREMQDQAAEQYREMQFHSPRNPGRRSSRTRPATSGVLKSLEEP
jgi:hypothetical protein